MNTLVVRHVAESRFRAWAVQVPLSHRRLHRGRVVWELILEPLLGLAPALRVIIERLREIHGLECDHSHATLVRQACQHVVGPVCGLVGQSPGPTV